MSLAQKIYTIFGKWKHYYIASAILVLGSVLMRMLEPKVLQLAVDGVISFFNRGGVGEVETSDGIAATMLALLPKLSMDNLHFVLLCLGAMYIGIALLRSACWFSSSALKSKATEQSIKDLRDRVFGKLQRLPMQFHHKHGVGLLVQRSTGDIDTVRRFMEGQIIDIITMASIFVFAFAMMAMVNLSYALVAISMSPVLLVSSIWFFKRQKQVWKEHEEEQDALSDIVQENLAGIRVVQAYATQDKEIRKFNEQNTRTLEAGLRHNNLHAMFWPLSDAVIHIQIGASIMFGAWLVMNRVITVGELMSFYVYAGMVSHPLRRIGRIVSQLGMTKIAIDRIAEILESEQENYQGIQPEKLEGNIRFENVWFRYREEEAWVLQDVSFELAAGELVAMLGPTGSGKSTIIDLLCRFYEPQKGKIYLDGIEASQMSKAFIRDHIGVVLQKAFLFSTTIKNNIAYAKPDSSDSVIEYAAEMASLTDVLEKCSDGYDTVVGEKGVTLSGGQKQRVALARTLVERPDILILDDATSALDTDTEARIQDALKKEATLGTTIVVTHRITAVQEADHILVFDQGRLVEEGTHRSLIGKAGFYNKMYELQVALEQDIVATV